ncbi:hypothetical protein SERLA73DRAFT_131740 [Serpula lacrymans var. lacrymans S7.3]|uniref:HMG box domain-containing protein n=1 Tax=Serpula lacrymans var. lacrymans (strain S7.3) TaxID=936435 RepID=F8PPU9_SERL3|nr:hypothetical protein SERLA73DRAFT_131740 [Serpula lacrymans var. lacrymans S7.3]
MAPKEAKPVLSDVDTSKKQLASRLSVAAQSMRQCATFVESVAQTVAKLPLDADSIEALQELLGDAPIKIGKRKARDDDGDGTKRKRVTKPKDPNAPKRPASAYILFQNEVRAKLKEQNPELPQSELLSLIGRRWTSMSQQEKEVSMPLFHIDNVLLCHVSLEIYI